ncbi:MAG TPA: hypothetical protein VJ731_01330 [Terriglobales bacterium]|nr:hypothetical protein [Terriglobales bacterium]
MRELAEEMRETSSIMRQSLADHKKAANPPKHPPEEAQHTTVEWLAFSGA